MEILLMTAGVEAEAATVLPALDLLGHTVRTAPRDLKALLGGPTPDAVMVDARGDLAGARSTCRLLRTTGLTVPLFAVLTEGGLVALNAEWGVDDIVLTTAGPAEVEAGFQRRLATLGGVELASAELQPASEERHRLAAGRADPGGRAGRRRHPQAGAAMLLRPAAQAQPIPANRDAPQRMVRRCEWTRERRLHFG